MGLSEAQRIRLVNVVFTTEEELNNFLEAYRRNAPQAETYLCSQLGLEAPLPREPRCTRGLFPNETLFGWLFGWLRGLFARHKRGVS